MNLYSTCTCPHGCFQGTLGSGRGVCHGLPYRPWHWSWKNSKEVSSGLRAWRLTQKSAAGLFGNTSCG